uniref:Uncharacterized protein n=1 Tax=Erwinia amylovora ATCC BAA-2158 TaxID=889211 RepID=E5B9J4_ERWAM|nr:hypothetical protein predicted by Glimmer/Critica [Erwinia amylovora ATCC BAA-2158]
MQKFTRDAKSLVNFIIKWLIFDEISYRREPFLPP